MNDAITVIAPVCGNSVIQYPETCDDGNTNSNDGCSSICQVESGWTCSGQPSVCTEVCGDSIVTTGEECDDGNTNNNDGCDNTCDIETGWSCSGEPSECLAINPTLSGSCGIDMVLIIDSSGSIDGTELGQMKAAFKDFVDAFLPNTPTQIAVVEFNTVAKLNIDYSSDVTAIKNAIDAASSGGFTNWDDGLVKAYAEFDNRAEKPDLYVFTSDGNPNRIGPTGQSVSEAEAVATAVIKANQIKSSGIRIITLGIGDELDSDNLKAISSADAYYDSNFATLAETLAAVAEELCGGTVTVKKLVDDVPASGWQFSTSVVDGTSNPVSGYTDIDGFIVFDIDIVDTTATVGVTETAQNGYDFVSASCKDQGNNSVGTPGYMTVTGISIEKNDAIYCEFNNEVKVCSSFMSEQECMANDCYWCPACNNPFRNVFFPDGNCVESSLNCQWNGCELDCNAECETDSHCSDYCTTNTAHHGSCDTDCTCSYTSEDCGTDTRTCTAGTNCNCESGQWVCDTGDDKTCQRGCTNGDCLPPCTPDDCDRTDQGTDSDGDGYDNECETCDNTYCRQSPTAEICDNGCDDDCDGYTDCADDDCTDDPACSVCGNGQVEAGEECDPPGDCCDEKCQYEPMSTPCDDGYWCSATDHCDGSGLCVQFTARDCSGNDIDAVERCDYDPDDIDYTWDFRNAFSSGCVDDGNNQGHCTTGNSTITHECSIYLCGADCETNEDCYAYLGEDNYCFYDGSCNCVCECEYSEEYCPPAGIISSGICYWGQRDCYDQEGCTLYTDPMICNDVCDPAEGPKDTAAPIISNFNVQRTCKLINITATATDSCSNIKSGYYFLDDCVEPPEGTMSALDGSFDETQEDIYAYDVDIAALTQGINYIGVGAEDDSNNKALCASMDICLDKTDPETTKQYGTPFYADDYDYITSNTTITLIATDAETCVDSGVASTWYRIVKDGDTPGDFVEYIMPFTITEEGKYEICFYSVDTYCNEEQVECQTVVVDNSDPETAKEIGEPKCPGLLNDTYPILNSSTPFTLTSEDKPETLNAGVYKTYYRYCEGEDPCTGSWNEYTGPFTVTGVADGLFRLEYYSVDNLGNEEEVQYEIDYMSNSPPVTEIESFAAQLADFNVDITDTHPSLTKCYYRVYDGEEPGEFIERECNSEVFVNVSELDFCPCGIGVVFIDAYSVNCLNVSSDIVTRNYSIDICNAPKFVRSGPSDTVSTNDVEIYAETHIPSDCRLDSENKAYEEMAYAMNTADYYNHTYTINLGSGLHVYTIKCWARENMTYNPFRWDSEKVVFTVDVYVPPASTSSGGGIIYAYSSTPKTTTTVQSTTTTIEQEYGTTTTIEEADNVVYEEPVYTTTTQESRATIREEVGPGIITGMASMFATNPFAAAGAIGFVLLLLFIFFRRSSKKKSISQPSPVIDADAGQ